MSIENIQHNYSTPAGVALFWGFRCYRHTIPMGLIQQLFSIEYSQAICYFWETPKLFLMANTYSQIYIQIVFAVKNRKALIHNSWEEDLYKYQTGIIQNKGQKLLAINGTSNHIHIFIGMKPSCCLSDLVRELKKSSTSFIKVKKYANYNFQWQEGFGAFSYGHSQISDVCTYIENQKEHHRKKGFKDEYLNFLKAFQIEFKDEYLFEWIED